LRIGIKLTLALVLPIVALTLLLGYSFQVRSRELLREELAKEGRAISRVVQIASEDYLRDRQVADLRQLADRITGYERVLGVRLFDQKGALSYQPATLEPYPFENWAEVRRALAEKRTFEMRRLIGNQPAVGFIFPLSNRRGQIVGAVQVLQLESYIRQDESQTRAFILQLTLAMVAAMLVVVLAVTRANISQPIARLVRSFREVGAREVPTRVPLRGNDEFAWLSSEFNGMCERLESTRATLVREQEHRRQVEAELRNAERLAGLGRLAAGLAHEIGTPLNVILGRAESVLRTEQVSELGAKHLGIIVSQSERIARIVRDMLDFARVKPRRRTETDLSAALRTTLDLLGQRCTSQGITTQLVTTDALPRVFADPDQLQQVFLNLASNALDAMPNGGRLRIETGTALGSNPERAEGPRPCVTVTVLDNGVGIAPGAIKHVFDPFYTTKDAGRGTGLGLSVAYGIVEEHGGWFEVHSDADRGTSFRVFLPILAEAAGGETSA
jgi:two-component system, NtrC family, sensor kinase